LRATTIPADEVVAAVTVKPLEGIWYLAARTVCNLAEIGLALRLGVSSL
jgi:hypothetical protein